MGDGDRLRQLYEAAGYTTLAAFARKAGVPEGTATKHRVRDSIPKDAGEKYIAAAKTTGADLSWLLTGRGIAPRLNLQSQTPPRKVDVSQIEQLRPFDTANMAPIPLWIAEPADAGAEVGRIAKTVSNVPGPSDLAGLHSAFAVRAWDDANAPWVPQGATLFVDPTHNGRDGDWCIFATSTENDGATLLGPLVGVRIGKTAVSWRVQRGGQRVSLPIAVYPVVWKIVYIKP